MDGKIKIVCSKFASLDTFFWEFVVVLHVLRGERTQSCDAACQDSFDYSHVQVKLFCKLSKRQPNLNALRDETLKGHFARVVHNLHLQREMPWLELDESRISFWEFWDRAISTLGREISKKGTSQNVVSAHPSSTTDKREIPTKLSEAQPQQMQQMQDLLAKQQQQLEKLVS